MAFASFFAKVDKDFLKCKAAWDEHAKSEMKQEQSVADVFSKALQCLMDSAQVTFSEERLSVATSSVTTVAEQQDRCQARISTKRQCTKVLQKLMELLNKHEHLASLIDGNAFAENLEKTISTELTSGEEIHLKIAANLAAMREEWLQSCVAKRRSFNSSAIEAITNQKKFVSEAYSKIQHGIEELLSLQSSEKASMAELLNEELTQLKVKTNRFLAANIDPGDSSFKTHLENMADAELRLERALSIDSQDDDLQKLIADVGAKLDNKQQESMLAKKRLAETVGVEDSGGKRRRLSLSEWIPNVFRAGA